MQKLLFLSFIIMFTFNLAHPVTPEMLVIKSAPAYMNGILFSLMALATFIFSPFWGTKIDRNGVKKVLMIGPIGYGVCQLGFMYFDSSILMGVSRFTSGYFAAAAIVSITFYISNISDQESKMKNLGLLMVANSLGGVIGQTFSGYMGNILTKGIDFPFLLQSILGVLISIYIFYFIEEVNFVKTVGTKQTLKSTFLLVKKMKMMKLMLVVTLMSASISMYQANIGIYLVELFALSPFQIALVNDWNFIISIIMNLFILTLLVRYFKATLISKWSVILAFIGLFLTIFINSILSIIPLTFFLAALSIYKPIFQKIISDMASTNQGELLGTVNSFNSLGMIIGSAVAGITYTITPSTPFYIILILLGIGYLIISKVNYEI